MITCPNCAHFNPEAATQCEACYTPLPALVMCSTCGAKVMATALFCGQCGQSQQGTVTTGSAVTAASTSSAAGGESSPQVSSTPATAFRTQLQQVTARLEHVQSGTTIELQPHLSLIHIGKPNSRISPDIDVSGFPEADIVSRVHADIRVEGDSYFLEDTGSSNGTYVNNLPLAIGHRHRLRSGDRISLGKGDKVSFLFQMN